MATLYSDPEWSSKSLEPVIFEVRRHVVKDKMPALFPDQLCKWREEIQQHSQEGYRTSLTDFWGKLIEYSLGDSVSVQRSWVPPAQADTKLHSLSLRESEPPWRKH